MLPSKTDGIPSRFLSTPSGWRATRSILSGSKVSVFLSTPSGWRATSALQPQCTFTVFLSTPSGWRATIPKANKANGNGISIHALRVEGDQFALIVHPCVFVFLSTPSGWRATSALQPQCTFTVFLSTPSGWRATIPKANKANGNGISIHALRVEGDQFALIVHPCVFVFLSTPSGWRATWLHEVQRLASENFYPRPPGGGRHAKNLYGYSRESISIHALRVEGD